MLRLYLLFKTTFYDGLFLIPYCSYFFVSNLVSLNILASCQSTRFIFAFIVFTLLPHRNMPGTNRHLADKKRRLRVFFQLSLFILMLKNKTIRPRIL